MTALHDRARKLTEKLTEGEWDGPATDDIADAMVSLARDFAREACAAMPNRSGHCCGAEMFDDESPTERRRTEIDAAIAAAEKGESK